MCLVDQKMSVRNLPLPLVKQGLPPCWSLFRQRMPEDSSHQPLQDEELEVMYYPHTPQYFEQGNCEQCQLFADRVSNVG